MKRYDNGDEGKWQGVESDFLNSNQVPMPIRLQDLTLQVSVSLFML